LASEILEPPIPLKSVCPHSGVFWEHVMDVPNGIGYLYSGGRYGCTSTTGRIQTENRLAFDCYLSDFPGYEPLKDRSFYRAQRLRPVRCEMFGFHNSNDSSPDSSLERRASRFDSGGTRRRFRGYRRNPMYSFSRREYPDASSELDDVEVPSADCGIVESQSAPEV
jgi:hypothetical protein